MRKGSVRLAAGLFPMLVAVLVAAPPAPAEAQEPKPVVLEGSYFQSPDGVALEYAWRYAPGSACGTAVECAAPELDDSGWRSVRPALAPGDLPASEWTGVAWFRRHLILLPGAQGRRIALRLTAPGVARVYLDGRLVLDTAGTAEAPEIPADHRGAVVVSLVGAKHLLAVRYLYPKGQPRLEAGFGFRLALANPALASASNGEPAWTIALEGGMVALPLFLAFLHLALFGFDRRARENLFYAVEMAAFSLVVLHDVRAVILPNQMLQRLVGEIGTGAPTIAILFALLTFYAVRTERFPRTWKPFVAGAVSVLAAGYFIRWVGDYGWVLYLVAMVIEVFRVEHTGRTIERRAAGFFMGSFTLLGVAGLLQALLNFGLIPPIGGVRQIYAFGILASIVGTSLYLARNLGESRLIEAENERKTRELARARDLQLSMLPTELPTLPALDLAATSRAATEVGGDYYDVRRADDGSLLLAFGDATGHGLAAGIVVTATKAVFATIDPGKRPGELLATSDQVLRAMHLPALRMSLALARLTSKELVLASAAMPPALVARAASGTIEEIGEGGVPLGTRLPGGWGEARVALSPGDTLLFASDGFAELRDRNERELGYPGVVEAFRQGAAKATAREVLASLLAAADGHRGARALADDMTFVVVRVTGAEA